MLLMFTVFGYLFLNDGMVGYRQKNLAYYTYKTFATEGPKAMEPGQTAERWAELAATASIAFPDNLDLLPAGTAAKTPWPDELKDFEALSRGRWNDLWRQYSGRMKLDMTPPEKPYDESKISGQFTAFSVCAALALVATFFLLRTLRRSMSIDEETLSTPDGRRLKFSEITRIDKRQWQRKGLAFVFHGSPTRRSRIDGMTYGGFKSEDGAPAEALMQRLLANFHGELVDYVDEEPAEPAEESTATQESVV
jgi:hypothetical protein